MNDTQIIIAFCFAVFGSMLAGAILLILVAEYIKKRLNNIK